MLVILKEGIYEVGHCYFFRWHDICVSGSMKFGPRIQEILRFLPVKLEINLLLAVSTGGIYELCS
jgi:hypothetical protein